MSIGDYIILGILTVIVVAIIMYLVKQKKNGAKCIGCPSGCKACGDSKNKSSCCCGCNTQQQIDD